MSRALVEPWRDPVAARQRFEHSRFIKGLWPQTSIAGALPLFRVQWLIDHLLSNPTSGLRNTRIFHEMLIHTRLRLPLLLLLGSRSR